MTDPDYTSSIWYNTNANIIFTPKRKCKQAIIHFCVNNGHLQNVEMTSVNNVYYFAINNVTKDQQLSYSFTYIPENCGAIDTEWTYVNNNNSVTKVVTKIVNTVTNVVKPDDKWVVTFFDDFNGPLDRSKWSPEISNNGGGNGEAQAYIDDNSTVRTENGCLVLQANRANAMDRNYTSGRINSKDKVEMKYGKIEARIKMPKTDSLWSAFWLLSNDGKTWGHGAAEIDIVEFVGRNKNRPSGAINYDPWPQNKYVSENYTFPNGENAYDNFHIYSVNWQPNKIEYFVDNNLYCTFTPESLKSRWTLNDDTKWYIILNVAISGALGGNIKDSDVFPDKMLVDWVKISQFKM